MADRQPAPRQQPEPRTRPGERTGSAEIRERQMMLVREGYALTVDGADGEQTRAAWLDYQAKQRDAKAREDQRLQREAEEQREAARSKAEIERTQAQAKAKEAAAAEKAADARTAEAQAKAAEAAAKAKEAEATAAATKAKADADKRAADAQRAAYSAPILAASIVAGTVYGNRKAAAVKSEFDKGVSAKNRQLQASAKEIERLQKTAAKQTGAAKADTMGKLAGHVRAVDQQGVSRVRGGIKGAGVAALPLLAEAILARAVAGTLDDGWAKDILTEAGTGLSVAGLSLFGKRAGDIFNGSSPLDTKAAGVVEGARNQAKRHLVPKAPTTSSAPVQRAASAMQRHGGKIGLGIGAASLVALAASSAKADDGSAATSSRAMTTAAIGAASMAPMLLKGKGENKGWSDAAREAAAESRQENAKPTKATRSEIAAAKREAKARQKAATAERRAALDRRHADAKALSARISVEAWGGSRSAADVAAYSKLTGRPPAMVATRPMQAVLPATDAKIIPTPKTPPPVPVTAPALEKASKAAPAPAPAVKGSGVSKAVGRLNGVLTGVALVSGIFSLVRTAKAEGFTEAAKKAARMVDPTGGAVSRALELTSGKLEAEKEPTPSELSGLAKQQTLERAAEPTTVSQDLARQAAEALMAPGQAELMGRVAQNGLDGFYTGATPPEMLARAEYMNLAADHAREVNGREPEPKMQETVPPARPQPGPSGAPRGWANPLVQEAAQRARLLKGF